ncbi:MAG: hypothetical protein M4579_006124 [Chaenotheca gracillima]|nr:MAG: hypothetical protein M4579_006124 [Chaenotheca gracillima]
MACTHSTVTMESSSAQSSSSSASPPSSRPFPMRRSRSQSATTRRRRRPSADGRRKTSTDCVGDDAILLKVDVFLSELERRLDSLDLYGPLNFDAGIARAHGTLLAVRDSCSHASGEFFGAGRRRAKVLVETVEGHYHDALATRDTLEQKITTGIRLMEELLSDFETRVHDMREGGLGGLAGEIMADGRRRVDEGLGRAREAVDEGLEKARRAKETMREAVERAVNRAREHGLIRYDDLPHPWRVNPHITAGYRFTESKVDCVRSMLSVSNELVNIWSHAVGLLIVLSIAFYFYPTSVNFSLSSKSDIFIAAVFFAAACECLVCSTVWHTMNSIAEQNLMERFACVDYTGISLLIAASIMTSEYTAFYCEPVSRWTYMIATGIFGLGGVAVTWHPTFNRADMNWARVAFYISLVITGLIPVIQLNITRGPTWSWYFYAPILKSVAVYLCGAIVYASQIPERWWPGGFDYVGGSHNLWHLAVLGGILFHYVAMQDFFSIAFHRAQTQCAPI